MENPERQQKTSELRLFTLMLLGTSEVHQGLLVTHKGASADTNGHPSGQWGGGINTISSPALFSTQPQAPIAVP